MNTDAFYGTASGLSFTMLGFWWAVVTFRHTELTSTQPGRRFAYLVSLYFLIPGLVSMLSLLAGGGALWRVAFAGAGIFGVLSVIAASRYGTTSLGAIRAVARWAWLAVPFYVAVTVIALAPEIARSGLGLEPLQVEGYLIVSIMFLGSQLAWFAFMQAKAADSDASAPASDASTVASGSSGTSGSRERAVNA